MSSRISSNILDEATRKLQLEWERTRTTWTDAKSEEFYQRFVEPLPALVAQAGSAMEELNLLMNKVRHDCE